MSSAVSEIVTRLNRENLLDLVKFDADGLVPTIVQDANTGTVLMMAWMSAVSLAQTLDLGETVFWSRSRQEYWHKGATSGHVQRVVELCVDCDGDTLLITVDPAGPACHTGAYSCFYRALAQPSPNVEPLTK